MSVTDILFPGMKRSAAIFDLDRTLIPGSSSTIITQHLVRKGVATDRKIPFSEALGEIYERFGENWLMMQPAKLAARAASGWSVEAVEAACADAAHEVVANLAPFARFVIEDHVEAGRLLVLATTSPECFVTPIAKLLGFDAVVATKWRSKNGEYSGKLDGPFLWGREKAEAVLHWASLNNVDLTRSYAYSDSYFDTPLLDSVGNPVAVNPDPQLTPVALVKGWPIRHLDKPDGVAKIAGREIQEWTRPLMRPELVAPHVSFEFDGIENIPNEGPALLVFNHRSYFDPTVMGLVAARAKRSIRGLGKKEVFDAPVVGHLARALGGIRVERASGSDEPLEMAAEALSAGEVVMMAPQGTIPRGPAFFDPELKGRWGAARLATMSGAPVIPIGLWGTEHVWPRSSRVPHVSLTDRPTVSVSVGTPVRIIGRSANADTRRIMKAISELLPEESRHTVDPTAEELARTYPPGYSGDPEAEVDRRPGTDTAEGKG